MIDFKFNWIIYDPSWIMQLCEFVWTLRSSVWVVFNFFLLIGVTDRRKISSDHHRIQFYVSLYPLSFFTHSWRELRVPKLCFYIILYLLSLFKQSFVFILLINLKFKPVNWILLFQTINNVECTVEIVEWMFLVKYMNLI